MGGLFLELILAAAAAAGPVPTLLPYTMRRSSGVPSVSVAVRIPAKTACHYINTRQSFELPIRSAK